MTTKIETFGQNFGPNMAFQMVIFGYLGGTMSFLDFLKIVLQLFMKCLGNFFDLMTTLLVLFLTPQVDT